ncbi:hypothetical protein [Chelatococcus sp.]|nr:hypothetical protein [Chelatococcus sp.]CAH1677734.1 hypothetical protein CHELA41_24436 [Hyphomicrobiales bacterium]
MTKTKEPAFFDRPGFVQGVPGHDRPTVIYQPEDRPPYAKVMPTK